MRSYVSRLATIALSLCLLAGCGGAGADSATPTPAAAAATPQPAPIVADAIVVPERYVDVSFDASGTVAEVLVREGDAVQAGAPLARLVARDLELAVAQSRASLAQAQAGYDKIEAGATPEEIAGQQALLAGAEANLQKTRQGNTTAADIASAQAGVRLAQAQLDALKNPSPDKLSGAELALTQARNGLQSTRDGDSATKTRAESAMRQAVESLTQAQSQYATAKQQWQYVQDEGRDPLNPTTTDAQGKAVNNHVNDAEAQQYYDAFVRAEAAMRSAEQAVAQAQLSYDSARQQEVIDVANAEAKLADAQQQFAALQHPTATDIAQRQAALDQARASLQKTRQGGTAADIAASQAQVDQAQANVANLSAPARAVDLAEAQGRIAAAKVALEQAERGLERATLRAPFAGTIAERNLEVGQRVGGDASATPAPLVLADVGRWKVETDNLGERDVVRFRVGSPARLAFDALPGVALTGKVAAIRPRGADRYGDMTYTVTVTPDAWDERLRWNMSATVTIEE